MNAQVQIHDSLLPKPSFHFHKVINLNLLVYLNHLKLGAFLYGQQHNFNIQKRNG